MSTTYSKPQDVSCVWCKQPLRWEPGKGYVHMDGKLYATRIDDDGVERDDHCALPTRS